MGKRSEAAGSIRRTSLKWISGLGLGLVWTLQLSTTSFTQIDSAVYFVYSVSMCVGLVGLIAWLRYRTIDFPGYVTVLFYIFNLLAIIVPDTMPWAVYCPTIALSGIAYSVLVVQWTALFVRAAPSRRDEGYLSFISFGLLIGLVFAGVAKLLQHEHSALVAALLSAVACVLFLSCSAKSAGNVIPEKNPDTAPLLFFNRESWRIYAAFFICGVLYGIRQTQEAAPAFASHTVFSTIGVFLVPCLALVGVFVLKGRFDFLNMFLAIPLFSVSGLLAGLFAAIPPEVAQLAFSFGHGVFFVFSWMFLLRMEGSRSSARGRTIAAGRLVIELSTLVGSIVGLLFSEALSVAPRSSQMLSSFLILGFLLSALIIPKRVSISDVLYGGEGGREVRSDENARKAVGSLVREYGLSKREEEMLLYLVQGWTQSKIADMLCTAPSTVKSHVKHIYMKAEIHSKDELLELYQKALREAANTE